LSEAEGHFYFCNNDNLGNVAWFNTVCLHCYTYNLEIARGLWFKHRCQRWRYKYKVTDSHVHWKKDNILETVL